MLTIETLPRPAQLPLQLPLLATLLNAAAAIAAGLFMMCLLRCTNVGVQMKAPAPVIMTNKTRHAKVCSRSIAEEQDENDEDIESYRATLDL